MILTNRRSVVSRFFPSSTGSYRVAIGAVLGLFGAATGHTQSAFETEGLGCLASFGAYPVDVDFDGRLDIVTIQNANATQLAVMLGSGFGIAPGLAILTPAGTSGAIGLVVGDVDSDGRTDAVFCAQDPVTFLYRTYRALGDGLGQFAIAGTPIIDDWATATLADVDLDGDLDVVAARPGKLVQLANDGTGSLWLWHNELDGNLIGFQSPLHLVVDDLDGDGDPDAAAMRSAGPLGIYTTNAVGLNAKLTKLASYPVGSSVDLAGTDMNGDGDIDLAVTGELAGQGLRVIEALGGAVFATPVLIPSSKLSSFVAAGDFDLDGRGDLATETEVYHGSASGLPVLHASHSLPNTSRTEIADFNGDHRPDLLLVASIAGVDHNNVGVIARNDGSGGFLGRRDTEYTAHRGLLAIGHYDGDGELDVLAFEASTAPGTLQARIQLGAGDGTFVPATTTAPLGVVPQAAVTTPPTVAADLNHDGLADLLVADANITVATPRINAILADGSGGFSAIKTTFVNSVCHQLFVGHINADADLDVIQQTFSGTTSHFRVSFGNGLGDFSPQAPVTTTTVALFTKYPEPVSVVDVTGDGLADLIVRVGLTTSMQVLAGAGDGSFALHSSFSAPLGPFVVAELNGDTNPDFALLRDLGTVLRLEVRMGLGGGAFSTETTVDSTGFANLAGVTAIDLDADGWSELVGWSQLEGCFVVYSNASGFFDFPHFHLAGVTSPPYPIRIPPLFGDVTNDGRTDAIVGTAFNETFGDIVTLAGKCDGRKLAYGTGCPGLGGFVPELGLIGEACPSQFVTLEIRKGLGSSVALVFFGTGEGSIPVTGPCDLLVAPLLPFSFSVPLSGVGAGEGALTATMFLPPTISGVTLTMQAFVADPNVAGGASGTAGLAAKFED